MDVPAFAAAVERRFNELIQGLAEIAKRLPPYYWASAADSISAARASDQFLITSAPRKQEKYGRP
jgi:hypothetical protein